MMNRYSYLNKISNIISPKIRHISKIQKIQKSNIIIGDGPVGYYLYNKISKNTNVILKDKKTKLTNIKDTINNKEIDYIFLTTKTYDYKTVAREIEEYPELYPKKAIVLCHNGIVKDTKKIFNNILYNNEPISIIKCVVTGSFSFKQKGKTHENNLLITNNASPWGILGAKNIVSECEETLNKHGISTISGRKALVTETKKLLVNTSANILSCLSNYNCRELIEDTNTLTKLSMLFYEADMVLRNSKEHKLAFACESTSKRYNDDIVKGLLPKSDTLYRDILDIIYAYGNHYPSSHQDFIKRKRLELESLNEYIIICGEEKKLNVNTHKKLIDDIKYITGYYRKNRII